MQFSDIYKSPRSPLNKIRHSVFPAPLSIPMAEYDSDLLSKDKAKQKEAVKRHLADKVRSDFEFPWPPEAPAQPAQQAPHVASENGHTHSHTHGPASTTPPPPPREHEDAVSTDAPRPIAATAPQPLADVLDGTPRHLDHLGATEDRDTEEDDSDAESDYSTVSEDALHFKPRQAWLSDLSDNDDPNAACSSLSPFRFESPDAVKSTVKQSAAAKAARRRKALREEMEWNDGLACFEARRDAWTGARTVRVRQKPSSPPLSISSLSPRRLFHRHSLSSPPSSNNHLTRHTSHHSTGGNGTPSGTSLLYKKQSHEASTTPPTTTTTTMAPDASEALREATATELTTQRSKDSSRSSAASATTASTTTSHHASRTRTSTRVETLLPIPPPILPHNNPMRASITSSVYISLYEKVIIHSLTPSCPINLADMVRACVTGWKRDGEWPPKPSGIEPSASTTAAAMAMAGATIGPGAGLVAVRKKKKKPSGGSMGSGGRRMSFGILGKGGDHKDANAEAAGNGNGTATSPTAATAGAEDVGTGKGIRKSLQRVLGLGHGAGPGAGSSPTAASAGSTMVQGAGTII